ncbi:hypothetical protein GALL_449390 [mine drainage metagenome]|uniref:Uncharacterized protein n=1 Tax=mine drainage metagenome TaxID=410659 RepID=A0A1J5Q7I4_9ZZZZ
MGLPVFRPESSITLVKYSAVGISALSFTPSTTPFWRISLKLTRMAPGTWPPVLATIWSLPIFGCAVNSFMLPPPRISTMVTSCWWALSHCGVTSGPGTVVAKAAWAAPRPMAAAIRVLTSFKVCSSLGWGIRRSQRSAIWCDRTAGQSGLRSCMSRRLDETQADNIRTGFRATRTTGLRPHGSDSTQ